MFSWTNKARRDGKNGGQQNRRAFRPDADRLESREVLTTFSLPGATRAVTIPGVTGRSLAGLASNGGSLVSNVNSAASQLASLTSPTRTLSTGIFGGGTTAGTTAAATTAGRVLNVAANAANNLANRSFLSTGASLANRSLANNATGAASGLGFTLGLGFTSPNSRFTPISAANSGLGFTNNLGGTTPAFSSNGATNGLAFSGGRGFTTPPQLVNTANSAVNTGLAFANSLGNTSPAFASPFLNSATNGLTFNNGAGFTNQARNPFFNFAANSNSGAVPSVALPSGGSSVTTGGFSGLTLNGANGMGLL